MANVSFLRGTQSNLDALLSQGSGYTEGAFYLTTDSDRLYFAQNDKELVHLNHNVIQVTNIASLPSLAEANVGDFYYAIAENVLCTKNANNPTWIQINKNTNDNTKVTGVSEATVAADAQGITVKFNIKQTTTNTLGDETQLDDIPVSFTIDSGDIVAANNVSVGLGATSTENGITVNTVGAGANNTGLNINSGENINIIQDENNDIIIESENTTYNISASDNKIILTNSNNDEDTIVLESSNDAIEVTAAADQILIKHKDYGSINNQSNLESVSPKDGETFTVIDGITTDKGHITDFNIKTVTLPTHEDTISSLSVESENIVRLTESSGETYDVNFVAGNNDVVLKSNSDTNTIEFFHKAYGDPAITSVEGISPNHGDSFTVLENILASNGHITGYQTKQITLPADNNTEISSVQISTADEGKLSVSITDTNGDSHVGTSDSVLYYMVNNQPVYNQGNIEFYTKDEIDVKIQGLDAIVYRGTVGVGGTVENLPTENVSVGDTYKVIVAKEYGGYDCEIGDLLIATGSEENGIITSNLVWTYVPSGDDIDSQYELLVNNNIMSLKNIVTKDEVGSATIVGGNDLIVSTVDNNITIAHETFNTTQRADTSVSPSAGTTVTVLDSIITDNGHITGYTNKIITLPNDKDTVSELSAESTETGHIIKLTESNGDSSTVTLNNKNEYITLETNTDTDTINIGHKVYGTLESTASDALTLGYGDKFNIVTNLTRDNGGHLSGYTTQEITLPANSDTTSELSVKNAEAGYAIQLTESSGDNSSVILKNGTQISLSADSENDTIIINHEIISTTPGTADDISPDHGGNFTVLDSINTSNGHIIGYKTKTINLPDDEDTLYDLSGNIDGDIENNTATFTTTLTSSKNDIDTSVLELTSSSLKVTASSNSISLNLEWGSF